MKNIRNFCIIAHIDHGKSTLADRLIEETGLLPKEEKDKHQQILDNLEIERERGITIKSQSVRLEYFLDNEKYILNLIDTPGHVDFSYEVSRALAACEGALLIVDATQGVEAQTLTNFHLAFDSNLEIIPVINKIDLQNADIEKVSDELKNELGFIKGDIISVSAKKGINIDILCRRIIEKIPPPTGDENSPLKALVFDAVYNNYKGVIVHIRVFDGKIRAGDEIIFYSNQKTFIVEEVGYLKLKYTPSGYLTAGEVGYFTATIKDISDARIGDTVTLKYNRCTQPLEGYKEAKQYVFSSIYPLDTTQFENLSIALEKLKLTDPALKYEKDNSQALGFGFRCGFLGMLHLEVVQERLLKEFDMEVILTSPSVKYRFKLCGEDNYVEIDKPADFPEPTKIEKSFEPYILAEIITPEEFVGNCIKLCEDSRGNQAGMEYLGSKRVLLKYEMPMAEILFDFYNKLKSISKGYASLDYEFIGYKETELAKLDILVAKEKVDAFSMIVYEPKAAAIGRSIVEKLKDIIPRQQFAVALQAAIGAKVVARETISPYRKDVLAKCYGGD
ncbi:MAG: translation elongation factor 4, partial [Exilispira sp.]